MCGENKLAMTELNSKMNEVITKVLNISKRVKVLDNDVAAILAASNRNKETIEEYIENREKRFEALVTRISTIEEIIPSIHGQLADLYATQKQPPTTGGFSGTDKAALKRVLDYLGDAVKEPKPTVPTEEEKGLDEEILDVEDLPIIEDELFPETLKKLDEVID